jgi:anti-anti-sigma regulatory factor
VVLDLSDVELCATRTLSVVAEAHRRLGARGGWLRLVAVNPRVAAALDAAELPAAFTPYRAAISKTDEVC